MSVVDRLNDPIIVATARRKAMDRLIGHHGVMEQGLLNELLPIMTLTLIVEATTFLPELLAEA